MISGDLNAHQAEVLYLTVDTAVKLIYGQQVAQIAVIWWIRGDINTQPAPQVSGLTVDAVVMVTDIFAESLWCFYSVWL